MCCGQSEVWSRQHAQLCREVLPVSSVLFVDSGLIKMGIVLNYITEHKAVLQMKSFCVQINYDFFHNTILHLYLTMVYNIAEMMSH